MNIINSGTTYQVYGDNVKTYKDLPLGTYDVSFSKFQGFFLTLREPLTIKEDKIYGKHNEKVDKILKAFAESKRNFGLILSGEKGIGKTLFAKLLSIKANELQLPVINVDTYIPGIAQFISSIQQEIVVLFDEFEKTFDEDNEGGNPQNDLLSLLDGTDNGKKLFIITCNDVDRLNDCFLNRPGRFHYHFMLTVPTPSEIKEYMSDKLKEEYHYIIPDVVTLSTYTEITYDCLRALAFELNRGYSFAETLADLNISRGSIPYYDIAIKFKDGSIAKTDDSIKIDLFDTRKQTYWLHIDDAFNVRVAFTPVKLKIYEIGTFNIIPSGTIEVIDIRDISPDEMRIEPRNNDDVVKREKKRIEILKKAKADFIPTEICFIKEDYSERYKFTV